MSAYGRMGVWAYGRVDVLAALTRPARVAWDALPRVRRGTSPSVRFRVARYRPADTNALRMCTGHAERVLARRKRTSGKAWQHSKFICAAFELAEGDAHRYRGPLKQQIAMATDIPSRDLPWTGERYLPQIRGEIELEHLHRYYYATQFCCGKRVLDIACGEGYGSEILAYSAAQVIGVDLSEEAVVHASRKYHRNNLEFLVGSCDRIPVSDGQIDLVVSFETIEHHGWHQEMMREVKRILCPEGILIISSPDRYAYSDIPGYKNEFHVKELYTREFETLLEEYFANVYLFGQRVAYGSVIAGEGGTGFLSFDSERKFSPPAAGIERPIFNLAIAADIQVPEAFNSLYEQSVAKSVGYQALQREIEVCGSKLAELSRAVQMHQESASRGETAALEMREKLANGETAISKLREKLADRDAAISEFREKAASGQTAISELREKLADRESVNSELREGLERFRQGFTEAERQIGQLKSSLSWRTTWPCAWFAIGWLRQSGAHREPSLIDRQNRQGAPENPRATITAPLCDEQQCRGLNHGAIAADGSSLEPYLEAGWKEGSRDGARIRFRCAL